MPITTFSVVLPGGIVLLAVAASSVLGTCTLLPDLAVKELLEKWKKGRGRE